MRRTTSQLRTDALAIWQAGVDAVRSDRLVEQSVRVDDGVLWLSDNAVPLAEIRRIVVVGAGKAGAGMAAGLESALGCQVMADKQLTGWVNVPENCVRPLQRISLIPARPAGVNEPTEAGVRSTEQILRALQQMTADDLCIVLLSGGGSALMPAPARGISLRDKLMVTKQLSAAGANIEQLNTVRKQLSRVKGGGLARACGGRHLEALIISDVLGDPLDVIASGPTVPSSSTVADALAVLHRFAPHSNSNVVRYLEAKQHADDHHDVPCSCKVSNHVIGNNAVAVDACGQEAERRGYTSVLTSSQTLEGEADGVGRQLATQARRMKVDSQIDCLISGGEPTVTLIDESQRGLGGRNQQLVLAALQDLLQPGSGDGLPSRGRGIDDLLVLSGGTDGEDGPTDAAGAWADCQVADQALVRGIDPNDYLRRNDAYHFFEPLGALIKTGPTHTNVCDVRVLLRR